MNGPSKRETPCTLHFWSPSTAPIFLMSNTWCKSVAGTFFLKIKETQQVVWLLQVLSTDVIHKTFHILPHEFSKRNPAPINPDDSAESQNNQSYRRNPQTLIVWMLLPQHIPLNRMNPIAWSSIHRKTIESHRRCIRNQEKVGNFT